MWILGLMLIALGIAVLTTGVRLTVLGAGIGALVGAGLLRLLQTPPESAMWLIVPASLAVLFALGAGFMRGLVNVVTLALGAIAGVAIAIGLSDIFGFVEFGTSTWILALVGAVAGILVMGRLKDWGMIIIAALIGALLTVRGFQLLWPSLQGPLAPLLTLVLAGGGIAYLAGWIGGGKQKAQPAP